MLSTSGSSVVDFLVVFVVFVVFVAVTLVFAVGGDVSIGGSTVGGAVSAVFVVARFVLVFVVVGATSAVAVALVAFVAVALVAFVAVALVAFALAVVVDDEDVALVAND